ELAEGRERMAGGRVDIEGRRAGGRGSSSGAERDSERISDIETESQDGEESDSADTSMGRAHAIGSELNSDDEREERIPDTAKSRRRIASTKSSKSSAKLSDSGVWDMDPSDSDEA